MKKYMPIYTLEKTISFEASHVLEGMPQGHQCGRVHGHSWKALVELMGSDLDETGMLIDFGVVSAIVKRLDHNHLNEVMATPHPTSENVCKWIYEQITSMLLKVGAQDDVHVMSVRVEETCTSACSLHYVEIPQS